MGLNQGPGARTPILTPEQRVMLHALADVGGIAVDRLTLPGSWSKTTWLQTETAGLISVNRVYMTADQAVSYVSITSTGWRAIGRGPHRRAVDRDGFVMGALRVPGEFGGRPGIGGLSSAVRHRHRVGIIVALDTAPDGALALEVVWIDPEHVSRSNPDFPDSVPEDVRTRVVAAYERGLVTSDRIRAEGCIALDAYLPEDQVPEVPRRREIVIDAPSGGMSGPG